MLSESEPAESVSTHVLDQAPFGIHRYELFPDGRLVFIGANETANRMLGVDHRQFVGKTLEEAFPSLVTTEIPKRYRTVVTSKIAWQVDQVDYDEQGIKGAFDVQAVPFDESQLVVYFSDITARLRTERALIAKQTELDTYFTNALDLLCIATVDGCFKRLNPEWERTLGYPVNELEGQSFLNFVHPDDLPKTLDVLSNLANNNQVTNFVNRYRCKDGSYRFIEWRSFPVGSEIYAIAHDVTEHTELLNRLRESEHLFRSVIDTMSELVSLNELILDDAGRPIDYRTLDANQAWEKALGRRRDEGQRTTASAFHAGKAPYLDEFSAVALGGAPIKLDVFDSLHAAYAQVSVTSPRRGMFVAVATDITERIQNAKRLEQALRELTNKSKELESVLYVTTHDLRSPLVNIQGFSSRIERVVKELDAWVLNQPGTPPLSSESLAPLVARIRSALDYITGSALKMDRLITGLLQLSRLGRRQLQWSLINMSELWGKVLAQFHHQIGEVNVTVETGTLPNCFGDAGQIDQVLANLLDNAIKYRDPNRPCTVSFSGTVQTDGTVLYRFSDSGRGIDPLHVDRIWELFHRLAPQTDLPGEGIGLTAVRQIVTRHHGTITVESEPGVGTTFLLQLRTNAPDVSPTTFRREHG